MRGSLDEMTGRHYLLKKAQKKVWEGVRKVPIPAQEGVRRVNPVQEEDWNGKEVQGGLLKVTGAIQERQVKEVMERTRPYFLIQ